MKEYAVSANNQRDHSKVVRLLVGLLGGLLLVNLATPAWAQESPVYCNDGALPTQGLLEGGSNPSQPDLIVDGKCTAKISGPYYYGNVNIIDNGALDFEEPKGENTKVNFWAKNIVVENGGALTAGKHEIYGARGGTLTIHLYGRNQSVGEDGEPFDENGNPINPATHPGEGVLCQSPTGAGTGPCGIPEAVWSDNGKTLLPGCKGLMPEQQSDCIPGLSDKEKDYFYQYGPLYGDWKCTNDTTFVDGKCGSVPADGKVGYFGYKTLAVSFGGTLYLRGFKGTPAAAATGPGDLSDTGSGLSRTRLNPGPTQSGLSWTRLAADLKPGSGGHTLTLAEDIPKGKWAAGDKIVVTTTDYLPDHSEELTITSIDDGGKTVHFEPAIKWFHNGTRFDIKDKLGAAEHRLQTAGMDQHLIDQGAETRAAVALLTRSIRVVSAGDKAGEDFPAPPPKGSTDPGYYFGAHMIFRQGFKEVHIQGVEFANMGQGGKIGHYPIHFHKARRVPADTIIEDSSINVSMTRWIVLHDTQGVTLARNVGYKSIGHGFFLEDGTEVDNNFYSNIGILARAAIDNPQNPRKIPGILADSQSPWEQKFTAPNLANPGFPYRSDAEYPTVFWITNGWNSFIGNMAAGATACGTAYWFVPMVNSDKPDVETSANTASGGHMKWTYDDEGHFGYAGLQRNSDYGGATPLKVFYRNDATSTMMSFQTTPDAPSCNDIGFVPADAKEYPPPQPNRPLVYEIKSVAPAPKRMEVSGHLEPDLINDPYYPHTIGQRAGTSCPLARDQVPGMPERYDCGISGGKTVPICADGSSIPKGQPNPQDRCAVTVLDHYTTSFHWAEGNIAAVWLRYKWFLFDNSVVSDVQDGGLNFVTSGDFTKASVITGLWQVAKSSLFIGHTQPQDEQHKYTLDDGPFNKLSGLKCDPLQANWPVPNYCMNKADGISMPTGNFFVNQRLYSIYDGPNYQDSNAFLNITKTDCPSGRYNGACMYNNGANPLGILKNPPGSDTKGCYLPNAAIAWKQPNGFFYPPAFHSRGLYFYNVDIRHYVIDPLVKPTQDATIDFGQGGSYITDLARIKEIYCTSNPAMFLNWTSIDRQTELNDDDGTLTGLSNNLLQPLGANRPNPLKQTISINEDEFFAAPVDTSECASNIGPNNQPINACSPLNPDEPAVTARTSPYDYVATVIYHAPYRKYKVDNDPGTPLEYAWDSVCSNQTCYGVPLYRQYLTGKNGGDEAQSTGEWKQWYKNGCAVESDQPNCRWPFIRMAGMNKSVRETLTVNNGLYYLDTTVPLAMQQTETFNQNGPGAQSLNTFQPGQTYDVFFVFAKRSTKQTYEIYVGKNRPAAQVVDSIAAVQVKIPSSIQPEPYPGEKSDFLHVGAGDYDPDTGIVKVTVDFRDMASLDPIPQNGLCQPHTFCKADGDACTGNLTHADPAVAVDPDLMKAADEVCHTWAVKDLDCPEDGCLGFSFTLPDSFSADATINHPMPHRPEPTSFPTVDDNQGQPTWLVKFLRTALPPDSKEGGQCHYNRLPGTDCTVP